MGNNSQISTVLAICFVATLVSPFFGYVGRGLRSTWAIFLIWLILFAMENRHFLSLFILGCRKRRFELSMLILWFLVVLLNAGLERGYTGWAHVIHTVTLGMVVFMQIAYSTMKQKAFRTILFWTIIIIGIEALRSLPILFANPGIGRKLMSFPDEILLYESYISGVGDYNLYTSNAIILPFFIAAAFSFKGIKKSILLIFCVIIGFAVFLSTFTSAVAIMVFGLFILAVFSYGKELKKFIQWMSCVVLMLFVFIVLYSNLADTEQVNFVISKLIRLFTGVLEYGLVMGDETKRTILFMLSLDTFLSNPFFGIGPSTTAYNPALYTYVGGHSSWIDQLSEYGFLGFGPFIAFAIAVIKRVTGYFFQYKNSLIIKASLVSGILYIIGGIVNPILFVYSIMVPFYLLLLGSADIEARCES